MLDLGIGRNSQDILAETPKAYRVMIRAGETSFGSAKPVWVPKSIVAWQAPQRGYAETLHIPAWFARKM